MNDYKNVNPTVHHLSEIFNFLMFWKKTILIFFFTFTAVGFILAFIVERQYKSVARVIPPKEGNSLSGLSSVTSLMRNLPAGIGSLAKRGADDLDYIAIMKSRTVLEEIIAQFDLKRVYQISDSSMEKTIKVFQSNCEIDWTEENMLEIRIWDKDPQRAADIANFYVDVLNKRSYELYTTEARFNRKFIEQRYEKNKLDLRIAEQNLKAYQETNRVFIPMSVDAISTSGFGEIVAMRTKKELEVAIMHQTLGEQHPQYRQALTELSVINTKMDKLPEWGIESLRLMREVEIQQKIMEFIVPMYEQAKVNENKDVPAAYVLDNAVKGERPDRPKRSLIVAISSFLGLIASFGFIIIYQIYLSRK